MTFPTFAPSSRQIQDMSFPVKTYKAQNGKEVRLLYGDRGSGIVLTLAYKNLTNSNAEQFLDHWREQKGNFYDFVIPTSSTNDQNGILAGYLAERSKILGDPTKRRWRYAKAPEIVNEMRGRSTVRIELVSVMV